MLAGTLRVPATPAWCMGRGTGWHQKLWCTSLCLWAQAPLKCAPAQVSLVAEGHQLQMDYKRSSHRSELLCGALAYESPPSDTVGRHTALRPGGLRLLVAVPRILA